MNKTQQKRLLRSFALFSSVSLVLGYALGVSIGRLTVEAGVNTEPIVVNEECVEIIDIPIVVNEECVEIIDIPNEDMEIVDVPTPQVVSLGTCKLTAYCIENYPHICNDGESSRTSTGAIPMVGRTCAVDPSVIPYGSEVIINGHTYVAEDCGGAIKGNRVDILFATHQEALDFGVQYADVSYVAKEK